MKSAIAAVLPALLLTACVAVPPTTPQVPQVKTEALGLTGAPAPHIAADWWTQFRDPQIEKLAGLVMTGNPTLQGALARLRAAHVKVLLTGMKAQRNLGAEYVRRFDAIYPRLAKETGVVFYPFLLDGVALNPKLNQADGMHPNPDGVKVIVARILPFVLKALKP